MANKITKLIQNWEEYLLREYVEPGWQPGANTIAYYTFNNQNLNDSSENHNNWAWNNWDGSFIANTWWYCADLWGSHAIQVPFNLYWLTNFTFNCWINVNQFKPVSGIFGSIEWTTGDLHCNITSTKIEVAINRGSTVAYTVSLSTNTWYNIWVTKSWTTYSIYVNGSLCNSWTSANVTANHTLYVWRTYSDDRFLNWYLDNVIFEDNTRTTTEISKYFQQTKSLYWIS